AADRGGSGMSEARHALLPGTAFGVREGSAVGVCADCGGTLEATGPTLTCFGCGATVKNPAHPTKPGPNQIATPVVVVATPQAPADPPAKMGRPTTFSPSVMTSVLNAV